MLVGHVCAIECQVCTILVHRSGEKEGAWNERVLVRVTDLETLHQNGEHAVPMASAEDFTKFVGANNYVFANFYAPWCVWCQVGNQGSVTCMPPRESCEEWKSRGSTRHSFFHTG